MSQVSTTDMKVFFGLANPANTRTPNTEDEDDSEAAPDDDEIEQEEGGDEDGFDEEDVVDGEGVEPEEDDDEFDEEEEAAAAAAALGARGSPPRPDHAPPPLPLAPPLCTTPAQPELFANVAPPMSAEDLMLEKQSVLLEMERLKAQGIILTREFTMSDNLADMQFEVRRHLLRIDESNSIGFMRDGLRLLFSGIEAGNKAVGPVLQLDGWSTQACTELDSHKYDRSLSSLYRKYWRRGSSSPEMDLACGILSSMATWHVKQQFMAKKPKMPGAGGGPFGGMKLPTMPTGDDSDDEGLPVGFMGGGR